MEWNTGPHKRKFLRSPGRFVDDAGDMHAAELVFWGEWEAQSRIVHRWQPRTGLPTVLHEPYWAPPDFVGERQNTDPWVFGQSFLYSNCKQHTNNTLDRRPSALQDLPRCSMILFGSGRGGQFVIDTVFVVAGVIARFRPIEDLDDLPVDDAFRVCTVESLAGYPPHIAASQYTLLRGATIAEPVEGMYSFVPCLVHDDSQARFARPAIHLPGTVNPASHQSPSGATPRDRRPLDHVVAAWHDLVRQVRQADLLFGVYFATPPGAYETAPPTVSPDRRRATDRHFDARGTASGAEGDSSWRC